MKDSTIVRFQDAAARGIDWIIRHQRENGAFCDPADGVGGSYKVPYALAVTGHLRRAQRLVAWVADHHFTADGNFRAAERKAQQPFHDVWPTYANAWLILGAHRLARWDLSLRGIEYLLRYQTAGGGFYAIEEGRKFLEPVCTSWAGLAALTTGRLAEACQAGDLLVSLVEQQPEVDRFYVRASVDGDLLVDVPPGADLFYYVDATREKQIYYNPGIALIFLVHLYWATADARYLDAGQHLFAFAQRCAADVYRFPPSGKLGLGCALLSAVTGSADAQDAAVQVGAYLVETQTEDGSWRLPDEEAYAVVEGKESYEVQLDLTAEFTIFLWEIASLIEPADFP